MSLSSLSGNSPAVMNIVTKRQQDQALTLARLATAQRINSAADNPAGFVISKMLQAQISGDDQASDNITSANSLLQTADGALDQTQSTINQMRSLALQAANTATSNPAQTAVLNQQFSYLSSSLDRTASDTMFGKQHLLDGSFTNQAVQTGASAGQSLSITIASNVTGSPKGYDSRGLGLAGANLNSSSAISDALSRLDKAAEAVGQQRGALGAQSQTLTSIGNSLSVQAQNLAAANSTISDTDFAQASSEFAKNQIMNNAGFAMLAQGNTMASHLLKLMQ